MFEILPSLKFDVSDNIRVFCTLFTENQFKIVFIFFTNHLEFHGKQFNLYV